MDDMGSKFDRFNRSARRVLTFAQEEAHLMNHDYIGTEHLLLGIEREVNSLPSKALRDMGAELDKTRQIVASIVGKGKRGQFGHVALTPRTKRAIELAVDEARSLNNDTIGPEHILLGVLREGEGVAVDVLRTSGIDEKQLRTRILQAITLRPASRPEAHPEIAALTSLVSQSRSLSEVQKYEITGALHVVAEELDDERPNHLVLKSLLLAIQAELIDAADIAEAALIGIAQSLRSMGQH